MKMTLLGVAALAATVPAMAQMQPATPAPRAMPPMATMPTMAPMAGKSQTRDQMVARVREHFAKMDTNRDGFVTTDEMQAMRGQHKQKMGATGGRRGDRMAMRDPSAMFDRLDANRDGSISRDEFAKGREMRIERKMVMKGTPGAPGMDGAHGGMMKMHQMGGKMGGGMMGGGMMKMADLNKDGRVSLQEATTSALQHFDMADTNRDGRITPDERRSMRQKMMQMRAPKAG